MSDLQDKANPIAGLSSALAYELKELREEQIITNDLLCTLCDLKESQNYHDDVFLKAWFVKTTHNTYFNAVGLTISFSAIYIAITSLGVNNSFFSGVSILWDAFKGLL